MKRFQSTVSTIRSHVIRHGPEITVKVQSIKPKKPFPYCDRQVVVSGPMGSLQQPIFPFMTISSHPTDPEDTKKTIEISIPDSTKEVQRQMLGTTRSLIRNMITGVQDGYTVPIRIVGVGYRAALEDKRIALKVGYANTIYVPILDGIKVIIPNPQRIFLQGIDYQKVTQMASQIRRHRPPEPYNQKGIFVGDETIKKKEGKKR
jgi:large subunit ribosomal protein L6